MTRDAESLRLQLPGLEMAGLCFGPPGAPPVVCLHGWLDNAASFAPLAAELPDRRLLALELAGHGHSGHRPAGVPYHMLDWALDVVRALDALGLERAPLIGHSMGASVALLAAGAAPDRVERLALLEGFGPRPARPDDARASLRAHHEAEQRMAQVPLRTRPASMATAVRARLVSSRLDRRSATLIAERGTRAVGGGVLWRNDRRLSYIQPIQLSEDHILAFLRAIACPVLHVEASSGMRLKPEVAGRRRACLSQLTEATVEGGHHVHMDAPDRVAPVLRDFLGGQA